MPKRDLLRDVAVTDVVAAVAVVADVKSVVVDPGV